MSAAANNVADDYTILGRGSYGAVFKPALPNTIDGVDTTYPGNVTKVFYKKNTYNKTLNTISKLPEIMNKRGHNAGHNVHTYTRKYKGRNLNPKLLLNLQKINPSFLPNSNLHLYRMPNLGYDISQIKVNPEMKHKLRTIQFGVILEQIVKLIRQTTSLVESNYAHMDIRPSNVMINPDTGVLTIVDFDLMKPIPKLAAEFTSFGYYNEPPECLLHHRWYGVTDIHIPVDRVVQYIRPVDIDNYVKYQYNGFIDAIRERNGSITLNDYKEIVISANKINIEYIRDLLRDKTVDEVMNSFRDYIIPTIDNFGLGMTLLQLLAILYPGSVYAGDSKRFGTPEEFDRKRVESEEELKVSLEPRVPEEFKEDIKYMTHALREISLILNLMCSFELQNRPPYDWVLTHAERILANYNSRNLSNVIVGGGGSGGGKRRRRRAA